ncbi:MAG: 2-phosphosulfolactate phosphatase [Chitinophagaceae bacterium]|nr:MAG: 2-phosphosulfolactate phosphatase [Bacteroidetes bacterium OLB11]MCC6447992.1 2-phosphosulfolactate phosphatase [Chitinophagaceae bacterium]HMN31982.1 2-phosphosulfolactate phosphatase [Chitinophagaceae bacterium]
MSQPKIETCFSPSLLHLYDIKNSIVVIIDIFRATSTITTALDNGAISVIPTDSVSHCIELGKQIHNSLTAGERDGKIADGLQHGNSPSEFTKELIENKTLILTTTNGTRLLHQCKEANEIIIGSFLNLSAVCKYLIESKKDVLLACASWKDRFNLEDTLFAGAVYKHVQAHFEMNCDSTRAAHLLYRQAEPHLYEFIQDSSHFLRLSKYGLQFDMEYCCQVDKHNNTIVYKDGKLVKK